MTDIPHFAIPFRFQPNGHPAVHEQDSHEDLAACAEAIVRTRPGQRVELPGFGVDDPLFSQGGADEQKVRAQIEEWEPRVEFSIEEGWDYDRFLQYLRIQILGEV